MKVYEGMVLLDSEFASQSEKGIGHVKALIEKAGGEVIRAEKYVEQKLAYEINDHKRGTYVLTAFRMDGQAITPLERSFKLDEKVLRSLILDRTGITLEKFFRHYEREEDPTDEPGRFRAR